MTRCTDPDAAPKLLAQWIGYAWDGLRDGRIGDAGYPQWHHGSIGGRQFQGGKQDLRDLAAAIVSAADGERVSGKERE